MLDSKVILQKRVLSKLSNRSPVVLNSYLESVSPRIDSNMRDIDGLLKSISNNNRDYYNLMYSFKVSKTENGKTVFNKKGSGLISDNLTPRIFVKQMKEIDEKKDQIASEIKRLKQEQNHPETSDDKKKAIDADISSFEKRLKEIAAKQHDLHSERATTEKRIKDSIPTEERKPNLITNSANKIQKMFRAEKDNRIGKRVLNSVSESALEMIRVVNESAKNNLISNEDRNMIIGVINESVQEIKYLSSYDMNGFPPVSYTDKNQSYLSIYENEQIESADIIDNAMMTYLSESALNAYDFILSKASKFNNLYECTQMYKEKCDCKNDTAVAITVLALESVLFGDISTNDCAEIIAVLESEAFGEFAVGNMLPQMGSTEGYGTDLANTSIEDVVKSTNALIDSEEDEEELVEEAVEIVPKNNLIFDREVHAVYNKILKFMNVEKEDVEKQFQKSLNFKKNKYIFNLTNSEQADVVNGVIGAIKGSGFAEVKDKGIVIHYTKTIKNVVINVNFNAGDDSVVFYYKLKEDVKQESVDEIDLYQEAVLNVDRYIDLFKTYDSIMESIHLDTEDLVRCAKCKILFERVDDSEIHDRIHEYEASVIANAELKHNHLISGHILTEDVLDTRCENIYNDICNHPFMEAISNNFDTLYESDANIDDDIKAILTKLHRKGYNTLYSCSGHNGTRIKEDNYRDGVYKGKLYTTARVTFDKIYDFKNIPNGWYKSEKDNKSALYVKPVTYDEKQGNPNEAFAKWKAVYLENLRNWAKALPENTKEVEESVSDFLDQIYDELL